MKNEYGSVGMLSGMMSVGESMFSNLNATIQPTADELEAEALNAQFNRVVKLKDMTVETFDLNKAKEAKDYARRLEMLFKGIQARTHVILFNERKFVETPAPKWLAHIEWAEFELIETHNPTVRGHDNEQGSDQG